MPLLGLPEFKRALDRVMTGAETAARESVTIVAADVEAEAKANFEGAHAKGRPHVGGDKPNVVTGTARRSIHTDPVTRYSLADYGTVVAPRAKYSRRLEFGFPQGEGRGHQHTRAFPHFMEPARKGRDRFREVAAERWRRFLL